MGKTILILSSVKPYRPLQLSSEIIHNTYDKPKCQSDEKQLTKPPHWHNADISWADDHNDLTQTASNHASRQTDHNSRAWLSPSATPTASAPSGEVPQLVSREQDV
jgi:hypothetical protein